MSHATSNYLSNQNDNYDIASGQVPTGHKTPLTVKPSRGYGITWNESNTWRTAWTWRTRAAQKQRALPTRCTSVVPSEHLVPGTKLSAQFASNYQWLNTYHEEDG